MFRIPYSVLEDLPVEVDTTFCIEDVVGLQTRQSDEGIVATGAIGSYISTRDNTTLHIIGQLRIPRSLP